MVKWYTNPDDGELYPIPEYKNEGVNYDFDNHNLVVTEAENQSIMNIGVNNHNFIEEAEKELTIHNNHIILKEGSKQELFRNIIVNGLFAIPISLIVLFLVNLFVDVWNNITPDQIVSAETTAIAIRDNLCDNIIDFCPAILCAFLFAKIIPKILNLLDLRQ